MGRCGLQAKHRCCRPSSWSRTCCSTKRSIQGRTQINVQNCNLTWLVRSGLSDDGYGLQHDARRSRCARREKVLAGANSAIKGCWWQNCPTEDWQGLKFIPYSQPELNRLQIRTPQKDLWHVEKERRQLLGARFFPKDCSSLRCHG